MYSQNAEEKAILEYFGSFVGAFIDIGANDGLTFSNTRALAERNWSGVFVEPSPSAFAKLKENYSSFKGTGKKLLFHNFAITDHNGTAILQESGSLINHEDTALVSTFHQAEMDRFRGAVEYKPVEVKCFRWKTYLNRLATKDFDFISMDCEGDEMHILPEIDLSKTQLLCIEWNSKPDLKRLYLECTYKFDMNRIIYESPENLIISR